MEKPRVMLNPSCQYGNTICDETGAEIYNEGHCMFDVASRIYNELLRDGRVEPYITRSSREAESSLKTETELTKSLKCDILVALHSDATGTDQPGGGTWSFYADDEGKRLAECIQIPLLDAIQSFYPEVYFRGIQTHWNRLWILHESGCPASLTEILFHSNPQEREMLMNSVYQDIISKAIVRGIIEYFGFKK